jgi:hypothetical protein
MGARFKLAITRPAGHTVQGQEIKHALGTSITVREEECTSGLGYD